MADDKKTLELQIRIAAGEALSAVSSLKGEMSSLAAEARKFSESNGEDIKRAFEQTRDAAERAAASMKLFGASSGELRQMQAQVKAAAVELTVKGLDPQSEEVKKLVEEYKRLGNEAADLDKAAGKNIASFGDLKNALGSLAQVAALTKAIGVIKDMGTFALSTADTFQTARNEFGTLLGDMKAGAGLFNEIKAFNDKTPFSLDTLTDATKVLLAAKVPLADLQNQLTKFGDLSQGNSQRFTSYINAFSKAAAKGKADMETLNAYINQGVPILGALGKRFTVTTAEIVEMTSQGKIGFEDFSAALDELTAEGGQYFGGMELNSQSLTAMQEGLKESVNSLAASFGEMLLPAAIAIVEALTDITNAINESPLLKGALAGALVAITGGLAAMAVKAGIAFAAQMSLNFAMGALNPVILAATVAVAALAAGYTSYASNQQKAAREAENLALKQRQQKDAIDASTDALQRQAEVLTDPVARRQAVSELEALSRRFDAIQQQTGGSAELLKIQAREVIDILETPINPDTAGWWEAYKSEAEKVAAALEMFNAEGRGMLRKILSENSEWGKAAAAQSAEQMLEALKSIDLEQMQEQLTALQRKTGAVPTEDSKTKKAWQEWFKEIAKIDPALFGSSGSRAAELYLEGFSRSVENSQSVSAALGTKLDIADMLRAQQKDIQNTIAGLISITPDNIDQPFKFTDAVIKSLIQRFGELGAAVRDIEYQATIEGLRKKIKDLGKSEKELAIEEAAAQGAAEDQLAVLKTLMDEYDRKSVLDSYRQQVESLTKDKYDLARASLAAAGATEEEKQELEAYIAALKEADLKSPLEKVRQGVADWQQSLADSCTLALMDLKGFSAEAAVILGDLSAQFIALLPPAAIAPLEELGRALAEGEDAAKAMGQALTEQAQQILRQLPMMFLQAGLQLILEGQWPLGLGLIAAAGSTAILSGFVDGTIHKAKEDAETAAKEHAAGGAYDEYGRAAREYAAGGAFTNRIVSRPTYFRYGGGLGLMGEAGPEAVMPLTRGSDGRLGVTASGMASGGTAVYVIIQNYTNEEVRTEKSSDSAGNQIRKIIIGAMKQSISSGEMDQSMSGRYGLRARGV